MPRGDVVVAREYYLRRKDDVSIAIVGPARARFQPHRQDRSNEVALRFQVTPPDARAQVTATVVDAEGEAVVERDLGEVAGAGTFRWDGGLERDQRAPRVAHEGGIGGIVPLDRRGVDVDPHQPAVERQALDPGVRLRELGPDRHHGVRGGNERLHHHFNISPGQKVS